MIFCNKSYIIENFKAYYLKIIIFKTRKPLEIERLSYINQPKNLIFDLTSIYSKKSIQRTKTNKTC